MLYFNLYIIFTGSCFSATACGPYYCLSLFYCCLTIFSSSISSWGACQMGSGLWPTVVGYGLWTASAWVAWGPRPLGVGAPVCAGQGLSLWQWPLQITNWNLSHCGQAPEKGSSFPSFIEPGLVYCVRASMCGCEQICVTLCTYMCGWEGVPFYFFSIAVWNLGT